MRFKAKNGDVVRQLVALLYQALTEAEVTEVVRAIFAQPDATHVERQLKEVAATTNRQFGVVTEIFLDVAEDFSASCHFPTNLW